MLHAGSFEEGLAAVIHQGGDADTNGAVAGSLLGARFGFTGIPSHLVKGLHRRKGLELRIAGLLLLLGAALPYTPKQSTT